MTDNNRTAAPEPPTSRGKIPRKPTARSAVSNGTKQLIAGDERGVWARRRHDIIAAHISDLGGPETLSEALLSLCRMSATIRVEMELMEARLSHSESVDLDLYNRLAGNLRRCLESIGLKRVAKEVTLNFTDYVAAKARKD